LDYDVKSPLQADLPHFDSGLYNLPASMRNVCSANLVRLKGIVLMTFNEVMT
jgi:hypothetical protein